MERINILSSWVRCFTCIYCKIFKPSEKTDDYFKCTHGWHRSMRGSYQKCHVCRKCRQHKYKRRIGEKI